MSNIIRPYYSDRADGKIVYSPPENIADGIFLHLINGCGNPVLAEGVVPVGVGKRDGAAQRTVSGLYNIGEKKRYHASHLIPHELGGSNQAYNLVSLPRELNQGEIRAFEIALREKAQKRKVYLQVIVAYYLNRDYPSELSYAVYEMEGAFTKGKPSLEKNFKVPQLWH